MSFQDQLHRPPILHHCPPRDGRPHFAHSSEAEFSRILDFYQIDWEYEPRSFPLRWTEEGRVIQYFTPDFFLPEFNLYVELTMLKQNLVTKKNGKLKRLRELYPDTNIRLFYGRDLRSLFRKYGVEQAPRQPLTA